MTIIEWLNGDNMPENMCISDWQMENIEEQIKESNTVRFKLRMFIGSIDVYSDEIKIDNANNINISELVGTIQQAFIHPVEEEVGFVWSDLYDLQVALETLEDAYNILKQL